jgi:hypothetical protein
MFYQNLEGVPMKIVRVTISFGQSNKEYFMDRPYDETKDDQSNCDDALGFLIGSVKDGDAIAIMKERDKKIQPVLINLKNAMEINILNVAVYQTKQQDVTTEPVTTDVPAGTAE